MRASLLITAVLVAMLGCTYASETPMEVQRMKKYNPQMRLTPKPVLKHQYHPARNKPRARYTFYPGSLKNNIIHLARQFGWSTVLWKPSYDFNWVGKTRLSATNIKDILRTVLGNYPLQAVFYQGNHVLVIAPRNIT